MVEQTAKPVKEIFEGSEYLLKGDLKELASLLGVNHKSVYNVFQGTQQSDPISTAIKTLIEKRKTSLEQKIDNYVNTPR